MRNLISLIGLLLLMVYSQGTLAIIPVEDIQTEINSYLTYTQVVQEVEHQIEALQNQIKQLTLETQNTNKLSDQQWDNAQQAIAQLSQAMQQGQALAYTMANVDSQFKQTFPGYHAPATNDYSQNYQGWITTTQDTMNGVMDQINMAYEQQSQEEAVNQLLKQRASGVQGRMQALQVASEIAAEQLAQVQKLKALMLAQTNAQAEYYAYQSQKDAAEQQSVDAVVKQTSMTFPQYHENPQLGLVPDFSEGH